MTRSIVIIFVTAALAGGLTACGKKGALEQPPASHIEAPAEVRPA